LSGVERAPSHPTVLDDDAAIENRLLRRILEVTSSRLELVDVARRVAGLITEATESDVCFVHLVDEERRRVVLIGATPPFDELAGEIELAFGEGIAGWVAEHAEPAIVPDKWCDPRYRYIPALRGEDYVSLVSVPMLIRGSEVVGVLNVHSREERRYRDRDLALLTGIANLMAPVVENARLYERLAERETMLEEFASRTVDAQELERRRVAGEIHDGISQRLISLWYHLLAAEDAESDDTMRTELHAAQELTSAALDEARTAITALRPPLLDDLGLGPSLESLAKSLPCHEVSVDIVSCPLPPHVEVALYRITQEALQNVVKHAGATQVLVRLASDAGAVLLVVRDNGNGFEPGAAGRDASSPAYGLVGMRERAELIGARLDVRSAPGMGTTVQVALTGCAPEPISGALRRGDEDVDEQLGGGGKGFVAAGDDVPAPLDG
jgi:signal transduction histidine kinase